MVKLISFYILKIWTIDKNYVGYLPVLFINFLSQPFLMEYKLKRIVIFSYIVLSFLVTNDYLQSLSK